MEKEEIHILNVRKAQKNYRKAELISYGGAIGSAILTQGIFTLPFFAAFVLFDILEIKAQRKIYSSVEFKRFHEIYKDILKRYIELNKTLEIISPISIYTFYLFAIKNGLLSINDDINYNINRYDKEFIREYTLNRHGLCRHIAAVGTDIYKELGFEASMVAVLKKEYIEKVISSDDLTEEEKRSFIQENGLLAGLEINGEKLTIDDLLNVKFKKMVSVEKKLSFFEKKYGNHAINIVNDDRYSYFLDASGGGIYIKVDDTSKLVDESGNVITIMEKTTKDINKKYGIEEITLKNQGDLSDMLIEALKTEWKIFENQDLINHFKKEIKEPLSEAEEIYQLILK